MIGGHGSSARARCEWWLEGKREVRKEPAWGEPVLSKEQLEWRIAAEPVAYEEAVAAMEQRVQAIIAGEAGELVWLVEHPPVITAGTSASMSDVRQPGRFPLHETGRGGQLTYHGPGQRVVYLMLDLRARKPDLRAYVQALEDVIIRTLAAFEITGERRAGRVGIWVVNAQGGEDKIAAIGVRVRRWVTFHGLAINVCPDLEHFEAIVPCGIVGHGVTSLAKLGVAASLTEVDRVIERAFHDVFGQGAATPSPSAALMPI